ncbi:MAG: thioredoxin family protein [Akkermansia sp.]|nr:thioredoxin family protein [Akkermansia sp.]
MLFDSSRIVFIVGARMRFFLSLCCYAAVSGVFAPQAGVAQQLPPIFGFANKDRIPEVNKSGSPVFDKLRNEAMKKKLPLVIYLTGSSWCSQCNIFTREYIKKTNFKNAAGKKFIFWLVDTKQVPGNSPGTFQFKMVPEEAAKIVGCVDSPRAPYVVLGPPAVFIIDPVSGKLIKSLFSKSEVDKYGKPLAGIIEETWVEFSRKPK